MINNHFEKTKPPSVAYTLRKRQEEPTKFKIDKVNEFDIDMKQMFPKMNVTYRMTFLSLKDNRTWPDHLSTTDLEKIQTVIGKVIPVFENTHIHKKLCEFGIIHDEEIKEDPSSRDVRQKMFVPVNL